jgi:hypothetical protein
MARKGSGFLNGPVPRKASVAGAAGLMMAKSALSPTSQIPSGESLAKSAKTVLQYPVREPGRVCL